MSAETWTLYLLPIHVGVDKDNKASGGGVYYKVVGIAGVYSVVGLKQICSFFTTQSTMELTIA
jgi:hypothetical protein